MMCKGSMPEATDDSLLPEAVLEKVFREHLLQYQEAEQTVDEERFCLLSLWKEATERGLIGTAYRMAQCFTFRSQSEWFE